MKQMTGAVMDFFKPTLALVISVEKNIQTEEIKWSEFFSSLTSCIFHR